MKAPAASQAAESLRELGMLVFPSLAALTRLMGFDRGWLSLSRVLDDQELAAIAGYLQQKRARGTGGPAGRGVSVGRHTRNPAVSPREKSARWPSSPRPDLKGGGM